MNHINQELEQYTGTEAYHRITPLAANVLSSDGAMAFAKLAKAFWSLDDMAIVASRAKEVKGEEFLAITITSKGGSARIIYDDGDGKVLFSQEYPFTDLLEGEYKFYIAQDGDRKIIYLPSEH